MDVQINGRLADPKVVAELMAKSAAFHAAQRNPNTNSDPIPTHVSDGRVFHGHGKHA